MPVRLVMLDHRLCRPQSIDDPLGLCIPKCPIKVSLFIWPPDGCLISPRPLPMAHGLTGFLLAFFLAFLLLFFIFENNCEIFAGQKQFWEVNKLLRSKHDKILAKTPETLNRFICIQRPGRSSCLFAQKCFYKHCPTLFTRLSDKETHLFIESMAAMKLQSMIVK